MIADSFFHMFSVVNLYLSRSRNYAIPPLLVAKNGRSPRNYSMNINTSSLDRPEVLTV